MHSPGRKLRAARGLCAISLVTSVTSGLLACGPGEPAPPNDDDDDDPAPVCLTAGDGAGVGDEPAARAAVGAAVEAGPVAGASVGVARGSAVVWLEAFGMSHPQDDIAATVDTPFAIASVTKVLVATAAMQLVEDGVLDLDIDVGAQASALAGVRNPAFPDVAITPRMLLTHTSTLWDLPFTFDDTWVTEGDAPISMREFVTGYFDPASAYFGGSLMWWDDAPPGAFSCYSNMGLGVVGVLIEELSGRSLEEQMRARIFEPLGMSRTSFWIDAYCSDDMIARGSRPLGATRADGFADDNLGAPSQPEGHPELASGMLKTTARDLLAFNTAIAQGGSLKDARILSESSVDEMLTRQLAADTTTCGDGRSDPAHQAIGFTHFPDPAGTDWTGHYGGMNGVTASLWFDPGPNGLRYVVLMNQRDLAAMSALEVALLGNIPSE